MALSVHKSAQFIADNSQHVRINNDKISEFSKNMLSSLNLPPVDFNHILHPSCSQDTDFIDWIFVIDSLNFCFWKSSGEPQWTVTYGDIKYTGYYALCAAIKKAKDGGIDITNAAVTAELSLDALKHILMGDGDVLPHLVEERHTFLVENSRILQKKYQGSFTNVLLKANGSATSLLSLIVEEFPSFRDEGVFLHRRVAFYKRAQILVADIYFCATTTRSQSVTSRETCGDLKSSDLPVTHLPGSPCISNDQLMASCMFRDIDKLSMFADYRVPQVLKYFGILEYSASLVRAVQEPILSDPSGTLEMELRGNSIEAVERLVHTHNASRADASSCLNAVSVDVMLWHYRRAHADEIEREPYHRVLSVYY